MKIIAHVALLLILFTSVAAFGATGTRKPRVATCVGATPCRACKNCRYCKHCAKDGGTCGVCRRKAATLRTWRQAAEEAAAR